MTISMNRNDGTAVDELEVRPPGPGRTPSDGGGRPPRPRRNLAWVRGVAAVVIAGAGVGTYLEVRGGSTSTSTPATSDIVIGAAEFSFKGPTTVDAGWHRFAVHNNGGLPHQAALLRLHAGVDPTALIAALHGNRDAWIGQADWAGGAGGVVAGRTQAVDVDLTAGEYLVVCFLRGGSATGQQHVEFGMAMPLAVSSTTSGEAEPVATAGTISVRDHALALPAGFTGTGTYAVRNDGSQPHELSILRLNDGATPADFATFMQAAAAAEQGGPKSTLAVPFKNAGGFTAMSPGEHGYTELALAPGNYVAVDFLLDDTAGNVPHFAEGVIATFAVPS